MPAKFEIFQRQDQQYSWRLKSSNGQVIATAGEGFASKSNAERAAQNVKDDAGSASIEDA